MPVTRAARGPLGSWLLFALALCLVVPGARAGMGGPDADGYSWVDSADGCEVEADVFMTPGGRSFFNGVSFLNNLGPFDLGFNFPFYDRITSQIWVNRSGLIFFGPPVDSPFAVNAAIPNAADPPGYLAPYWTLMTVSGESVYSEQRPGEGSFKLGFNMVTASTSELVQFEVYFYQNGDIRVEYLTLPVRPPTVTLGMEAPNETTGLQVYYNGTAAGGFDINMPRPFSICYSRPPVLDCGPATPISCGVTNSQSPGSVSANVDRYGCGASTLLGNEKVFRLSLTEVSDVDITVTDGSSINAEVFLLRACDEFECLGGGGGPVAALSVPPGTYYVVVDTPATRDDGTFTLNIQCTPLSQPISCEESLSDTTATGLPRMNGYPCLAGDMSGPEHYYTLDFLPPGNINASVTSAAGHGVLIFDATQSLTPGNCLRGGVGGTILYDPPPGTYMIVVDGPAASGTNYTLQVNCAPEISCTPGAGLLGCNTTIDSTTVGRTNLVDFYRCTGLQYSGPEAVYTLNNPVQQVVSFILDDSADDRLDIILLDSCNEGACVEVADSNLNIELAPGTYYLVIDGREGAAAPYTLSTVCGVGIEPASITITGAAGQCFTEHKTAWLTPDIPKADVLFAIDLTGSMGAERAALQANMQDIIDNLQTFISDVNFGLVSYKDYIGTGSGTVPCSYNASSFGSAGDYPYQLHQPITGDRTAIQDAVNNLPAATGGNDASESYSRVLFESYRDPGIGWRPGSRRLLVDFGDELPHDCNILECFGEVGSNRGMDLGRDGLVDTGDELAILDVLQGMVDNQVVLLHLNSGPSGSDGGHTYTEIWDCWAAITGGNAYSLNADGTVPSGVDLPELVGRAIAEQGAFCSELELIASPGFETWLTSASPVYFDVSLPAVAEFDIEICVPAGTPPGTYDFEVQVLCSGGVVVSQQVHVVVTIECAPSVVTTPPDRVICEGSSATLDASGMSLVNCGGTVQYEWRDGPTVVGTTATVMVNPTVTTTYDVSVTCSTDATCEVTDTATVEVHVPPLFDTVRVADPADCNAGIEVSWDAATFRDATGTGVYNVYRSEMSCADATTRAPLATGLTTLRWVDAGTRAGRTYYYVVEAEDARGIAPQATTACTPQGPNNGGTVTRVCSAGITEGAQPGTPAGVFATLFASHLGQEITLSWSGARALLAGEHFHLIKALNSPTAAFMLANGEGDVARTHVETDTSARVQFFDLRVANNCEVVSDDEFPPGYDN